MNYLFLFFRFLKAIKALRIFQLVLVMNMELLMISVEMMANVLAKKISLETNVMAALKDSLDFLIAKVSLI